jgi:hypothetical protein
VQYMFCDPDILRHDSERSSKDVTSGLGQNRKSSMRAYVFRFAPESRHYATHYRAAARAYG